MDYNEKKYKEKEYAIEKREDQKPQEASIPSFRQIFYSIPISGSIASFADYNDGIVYFSSLDSHIYAVDAKTGEMKWKFKTGAPTMSTPIVHDGKIYVGSNDELEKSIKPYILASVGTGTKVITARVGS
ncbi:MAG: PQQ-binding-like beta-propeller repeat protein [Candidatus Aenigmarchaeota archaeon]|nr:PQQ-binding-like beta-propeller repeat protein [Candidatus Aenigmarchaeota archaeon]